MYCIISSYQDTEKDQRRFAKKAQQLPTHGPVGTIIQALQDFSAWAFSLPCFSFPFYLSFAFGLYLFWKGAVNGGSLSLSSCVCALLLYTPRALALNEGPAEFCITLRERPLEENPVSMFEIEIRLIE